jgi:hypothetical protein
MTLRTRSAKPLATAVVLIAGICSVHALTSTVRANATMEWALQLIDFAALPITGTPDGAGNNAGSLARINFMREEPSPTKRLFVNDLTGPLYILDRNTKRATKYLDFDGRGSRPGLFDKLAVENGLASGFISFQFDPDYARNGKFDTHSPRGSMGRRLDEAEQHQRAGADAGRLHARDANPAAG